MEPIGAPALYANIPILNIKNEARTVEVEHKESENTEKVSVYFSDIL